MNKEDVKARLLSCFGTPTRDVVKVTAWELGSIGVVLQKDQPNRDEAAFLWLPYPPAGEAVPEIALQYAAESGRHSGTYASSGLGKGEPALKLVIRTERELAETLAYVDAMNNRGVLPQIASEQVSDLVGPTYVDPASMPATKPLRAKREAVPRAV